MCDGVCKSVVVQVSGVFDIGSCVELCVLLCRGVLTCSVVS